MFSKTLLTCLTFKWYPISMNSATLQLCNSATLQLCNYSRARDPFLTPILKRHKGFTLFELMVTLCIVSILATIALPGFRKTMREFRLNAFVDDYTDLIKAERAHHLIMNEWPPDTSSANILPSELIPFLPKRFYRPSYGYFVTRPFRDFSSGVGWDIDNWPTGSEPWRGYFLTVRGATSNQFKQAKPRLESLDFFRGHLKYLGTNIYYKYPDV